MTHIEDFSKQCQHCTTEEEKHYCGYCKGTGIEEIYYRRTCNFESRHECEWGGDCEYCPDSERISKEELSRYYSRQIF